MTRSTIHAAAASALPDIVVTAPEYRCLVTDGERPTSSGRHVPAAGVAVSDNVQRRWKAFRLAEPVYRLTIRGAPKAQIDQDRFDLVQLALHGIDVVVSQQASIDGSVSLGRVIDHLAQVAARMAPGDPRQDARKAAKMVSRRC